MHPNPIAKARFENQKAMYEEEDKKLKERWEKERAAEKSAARGKGAGDNEDVFEKIGRDYAENAQAEQEIEDKRWEGFGDFFAKEGGTAGQRQAPGFNYGGRESEHSGRSRSDNMALAMGVEEELLDKIAAEAKEKKGKDIFTEGIESSVWSTSAGITGLADMFIGKPLQSLGWEDNFISEWNKYYQDKAEEKHQDVMDAAARTGKGKTAETAAILVEMLGEAGIDALLGMVTGGISLAGKGGKVLKYADDVGDLAKLDLDDISNAQKSLQGTPLKRTIKERINDGELSTRIHIGRQNKHIEGTKEYLDKYKDGSNPQGVLTISKDEAQKLIDKFQGTGTKGKNNKNGEWTEFVDADTIIGKYYRNGQYWDTKRFVIHYSKKGSHIIPVQPREAIKHDK